MTDPNSGGSQVSFLIWLAELDAVIVEVLQLGLARGERELALALRHELELAAALARDRLLARKAFHFVPSAPVAGLARDAIESSRRHPRTSLGDPGGGAPRTDAP